MGKLKVIPVIDILRGKVVLAYKGRRHRYVELKESTITNNVSLEGLIKAFYARGYDTIYIADLDSIVYNESKVLGKILSLAKEFVSINFLIDIGRKGLEFKDSENIEWVIGTEYLKANEIMRLRKRVISLDISEEFVVLSQGKIPVKSAISIVKKILPKKILAICLDRVGSLEGLNYDIAYNLAKVCKDIEVIMGGGLRGLNDMYYLKFIGISGVLVATALHKGIVNVTRL